MREARYILVAAATVLFLLLALSLVQKIGAVEVRDTSYFDTCMAKAQLDCNHTSSGDTKEMAGCFCLAVDTCLEGGG